MKCLIETQESAALLLAYCARKLDAENTALLERHIEICPACQEFANGQRALWEALDSWEAAPVAADFDRRLYQRIEKEVSWRSLLMGPTLVRQALPFAAAACVVVMAGALLRQPAEVRPAPATESAQVETVQPEQVEHALEAMQMLSDFSSDFGSDLNHRPRPASNQSQM